VLAVKTYCVKDLTWGLGNFGLIVSHSERATYYNAVQSLFEKAVQQRDLPDVVSLSCQNAVRSRPL